MWWLNIIRQVGVLLGKHRGWILRIPSLIKIEKQHSPSFLLIHIVDSTFHQTNYCSRLQTIRWFRRSDWKSVGLPFRLKELRTFSCFPVSQHSGFYFPPPATGWRSPFLSRMGNVLHASVNQLLHSCPLQEENLPLHSCNLQVLHNSMNLGSYRPANKVRRFSVFPCNSKMPHFKLVACKKAAP